jgi:hypothetical protein
MQLDLLGFAIVIVLVAATVLFVAGPYQSPRPLREWALGCLIAAVWLLAWHALALPLR